MKETDIFRRALLALNMDFKKIAEKKITWDQTNDWENVKKKYETAIKVAVANRTSQQTADINAYNALKDEDPGYPIEIQYCEEFLESAENYCASLRPWYWLLVEQIYEENDRKSHTKTVDGETETVYDSYRNCEYCYLAPDDMLYPYIVNDEYNFAFERMGDYIYFKEAVSSMYYISENSKHKKTESNGFETKEYVSIAPDLYYSLIASRLALEIAPFIAPDTTVEQRATQQFQLNLQALLKVEEHSRRERNAKPEEFIL